MLSLLIVGAVGIYTAKNKIKKNEIENQIEEFFLKTKDKHIMFLLNDEGGHYKKENNNTVIIKELSDSIRRGRYGYENDFSDEKDSWRNVSKYVLDQVEKLFPSYNHIYYYNDPKVVTRSYKGNKMYLEPIICNSKNIVVHKSSKFLISAKVILIPADCGYLSMTYALDQIKIVRL